MPHLYFQRTKRRYYMNWNKYSELEGEHAFLSPSNYHWINYSPEKLQNVFKTFKLKEEGIWFHNFASMAISKKLKLSKTKATLNMFVNDCIGFNMKSEQILYYSPNAFGTTDAISFKANILRIFDYKSGTIKASFKQLDVYAALFCLEYRVDPTKITIEERIYQNNEYVEGLPTGEYIRSIMDRIIEFDSLIETIKMEEN